MSAIKDFVYELNLRDTPNSEQVVDMVGAFLRAHGIDVDGNRVSTETVATVARLDDGSFQFSCSIFREGLPACETCHSDILKDKIEVPLAAPVPVVPGAVFWPNADDTLPRVLPEDPESMRDDADRMYLDGHAGDVAKAALLLDRRRKALDRFLDRASVPEAVK